MSLADRYLEESVTTHMQGTLDAHRNWMAEHQRLAAEYEQHATQLAAWRVQQMADIDSRYRAQLGIHTSQLVTQLPPDITRAIEQGEGASDGVPV